VLQCVAVCYSVLQCVAVQCVAECYSALQCIVAHTEDMTHSLEDNLLPHNVDKARHIIAVRTIHLFKGATRPLYIRPLDVRSQRSIPGGYFVNILSICFV